MDIGWIWVGYIQDGLLGPFGPTKIVPGGLKGGQKWPKNVITCAFMAISDSGGSKWLDLGWIWVGYIQDGLLGSFGPTEIAPGASRGVRNGPKMP